MIAFDAFNDTSGVALESHTADTGGTWSKHSSSTAGASMIISQAVRARPDNASAVLLYYMPNADPATAEHDVEAPITYVNAAQAGGAAFIGVSGRLDPTQNTHYHGRYRLDGNGTFNQWDLLKFVNGTATTLASFSQTLTVGQTYNLKLEIRDATKKVYVDGVERISSTDNAITAKGKVGLRDSDSAVSPSAIGYMVFESFDAVDVPSFVDNFTGTSGSDLTTHTSDSGSTWSRVTGFAGAAQISNANRARGNSAGTEANYVSSWTPASADYDVLGTFTMIQSTVVGASFSGRAQTGSHEGYDLRWNPGASPSPQMELLGWVNNVATLLGTSVQTYGTNSGPLWRIEMRGTSIKVYDGIPALRISVVDSGTSTKGSVGMRFIGGTTDTTRIHIDNIFGADSSAPSIGGPVDAAIVSFDSDSDLSGSGNILLIGAGDFLSDSNYTGSGTAILVGGGNFTAESQTDGIPNLILQGLSTMGADSDLSGAGSLLFSGSGTYSSDSNMSGIGTVTLTGGASLTGESTFTGFGSMFTFPYIHMNPPLDGIVSYNGGGAAVSTTFGGAVVTYKASGIVQNATTGET